MKRNRISQRALNRYAVGDRTFTTLDRDDGMYNFNDTDLRGAVFSGAHFFASFRNANLEDADFSNCNIKTCDFTGANLRNSNFKGSVFDGTIFEGTILDGADFEDAGNQGHDFKKGETPLDFTLD